MRTFYKNFLLFIFFFITASSSCYAAPHTLTLDDVDFDKTTGAITSYSGDETDIEIPASFTVNGEEVDVEEIGYRAFSSNSLTSVIIPNSVTSIGYGAFNINSLTSVSIPSSVISIGAVAFANNSLTSVTIPNSVTSIDYKAFGANSLTSITIPNSVTSIGEKAFFDNSLTSVSLSRNLTLMGVQAFNCNSITTVNGDPSNGLFFARNEDGSVDSSKIVSYGGDATDIDFIPNTVTSIGENAFEYSRFASDDSPLTSLELPDNLTYIGPHAFFENNLTSLALPDDLTFIGEYAFIRNDLTSIRFPENLTYVGDGAFMSNSLSSIALFSSLTSIGSGAFDGNDFTSFALPDSHPEFASSAWRDGNDDVHEPGDEVSDLGETYTLENVSNVHYILQGGENAPENPFSFDENEGVSSFSPATHDGYDFLGWFDEDGNEVNSVSAGTSGDVFLYARWDVASGIEKNTANGFHLYPNPASQFLVIDAKARSCEIFDISGRMVLQQSIREGRRRIDVSSLPNGIYIVKAGQKRERLVIQR